jgi:hypothetical protein
MEKTRRRLGRQASSFAEFHNALFGAEPAGAFVELRIARPQGGMGQRFFDVRDVASVEQVTAEAGPKTDVYVSVNPRSRREGKRSAIERCHVLHVDVDGDRERLRAFRPLPSIVVSSGAGLHTYWSLLDPIGPDEAEVANRQLALAVDGDLHCVDAARILRLPGTLNHKTQPPRPVEILRLEAEVFRLEEVVGHLPPPASSRPPRGDRSTSTTRREFDAGDVLAKIAPPMYVRLLANVDVPDRGGMVRCPLPGHEDRTPSCYVYPEPEQGFYCFGCGRGGSLIDFAAELWNVSPRGRDFHDLRRRLARALCGMEVSA